MIEIKNLSKSYNNIVALDDVSLTIFPSEHFFILGPSGCGKTTLLKLISGILTPDSGDIILNQKSLLTIPPEKRPTNTIFQNLALFPHLNVYDNIAFGLRMKKKPAAEIKERVASLLGLIGLTGHEKRNIRTLSGGEQQRVAIARSLANKPEILLLDEPLSSLDLLLKDKLQNELRNIKSRMDTTFIHVTHDQGEALALADRIALMRNGKIVQLDTPENLYNNPLNKFSADFIGDMNTLKTNTVEKNEKNNFKVKIGAITLIAGKNNCQRIEDSVWLCIRPELIHIYAESEEISEAYSNKVPAIIQDIIFKGDKLEIITQIAGQILKVKQPHLRQKSPAIGEKVVLAWKEDDTILVNN